MASAVFFLGLALNSCSGVTAKKDDLPWFGKDQIVAAKAGGGLLNNIQLGNHGDKVYNYRLTVSEAEDIENGESPSSSGMHVIWGVTLTPLCRNAGSTNVALDVTQVQPKNPPMNTNCKVSFDQDTKGHVLRTHTSGDQECVERNVELLHLLESHTSKDSSDDLQYSKKAQWHDGETFVDVQVTLEDGDVMRVHHATRQSDKSAMAGHLKDDGGAVAAESCHGSYSTTSGDLLDKKCKLKMISAPGLNRIPKKYGRFKC